MPLSQQVLTALAAGRVEINNAKNSLIAADNPLQHFEAIAPHITQTAQISADLTAIRTLIQNVGTQLAVFGNP